MKVCMLAHNPPFQGGIVQYCVLLANALYKEGVDLNVCGFKKLYPPLLYKGKLPKENRSGIQFDMENCNFIKWYNPLSWLKVYWKLRKADVFHFHWVSPLLAPLQYLILKMNKMFAKKKVVVTCHNIEPHESTFVDKIFTKMVFSKIDEFVVHAEQNKERLIRDYKINSDRIHVIHHGSFDFFQKWDKEIKKLEFGFDNKRVILFFGYIREYKGLRYLLRALPGVLKENEDVVLVVAGELWQKWDSYKKEIERLGISDKVKIYPYYILDKDVHKFFNIAEIVVLPYYNSEQTISGPLLVSLAFNKPTIICPVGGISELVKDGQEVLFSKSGDFIELSENINRLLKDKSLQRKLISNTKRIKTIYSWDKIAKDYKEVYEK